MSTMYQELDSGENSCPSGDFSTDWKPLTFNPCSHIKGKDKQKAALKYKFYYYSGMVRLTDQEMTAI